MRRLSPEFIRKLRGICADGVWTDVPMSRVSRWRIGGKADCIVAPGTVEELAQVVRYAQDAGAPMFVIGATSNLLFPDEGVRALIVSIGPRLASMSCTTDLVSAQAGVWVPKFARAVSMTGLSGAEHAIGIPGTLGGLICMNGGTHRKGVGDNLKTVTRITRQGNVETLTKQECEFAYRTSVFQSDGSIVAAAEFAFSPGDPGDSRRIMLKTLRERRQKFPLKTPNCGSVFESDPSLYEKVGPPGAALEACGFKGRRVGGVVVSNVHANFIVNTGTGTAKDVLCLVRELHAGILRATGVSLRCEVRYVTPLGDVVPLHAVALAQ